MFDEVEPEPVDETIKEILRTKSVYDDAKWEKVASALPDARPEEVNGFIGGDIYINYGKTEETKLKLLPIPDYMAIQLLFNMGGGKRSRRRRTVKRRITKYSRKLRGKYSI